MLCTICQLNEVQERYDEDGELDVDFCLDCHRKGLSWTRLLEQRSGLISSLLACEGVLSAQVVPFAQNHYSLQVSLANDMFLICCSCDRHPESGRLVSAMTIPSPEQHWGIALLRDASQWAVREEQTFEIVDGLFDDDDELVDAIDSLASGVEPDFIDFPEEEERPSFERVLEAIGFTTEKEEAIVGLRGDPGAVAHKDQHLAQALDAVRDAVTGDRHCLVFAESEDGTFASMMMFGSSSSASDDRFVLMTIVSLMGLSEQKDEAMREFRDGRE